MGRPLFSLLVATAACLWLGCSETASDAVPDIPLSAATPHPDSAVAAPSRTVRGIEPEAGALGTAQLPRVEIGTDLRTVALSQPRFLPRWREHIELTGARFEIDVVRPDDVGLDAPVQIDVMISVSDIEQRLIEAIEDQSKTVGDAGREWLRGHGTMAPGVTHTTIPVVIPDGLRGRSALLDVILRPLGTQPEQSWSMPPIRIEADHVLRFGYGVEEPAWKPGWPAAAVRVEAWVADDQSDETGGGAIVGGESEGKLKATPHVIFERRIDPARDPRDRRWHDAYVPLGELAGMNVMLRFVLRAIPVGEIDHSLLVLANPVVVPGRTAGARPPARDVVLISLDTLRAPSVSAYGYARPTTPRMDALLSERGARFVTTFAPRPYTPPSHMTMLTGLHPCAHGVDDRHHTIGADRPLLAERLRAAGYLTAAFTENANVAVSSGFARGFDQYSEVRSEESATPGFASETFGRASDWVRRIDDRPFFLFVHTYQVHDPYEPPAGYREMFGGDIEGDVVPAKHRGKRDDYDREIRYTDSLVADFLDVLEHQGLGDALVIVTSDHGEAFGEHFWTNHGFSTHDEAILVPLFVRAPSKVEGGLTIDARAGLVDIVPTVLDLLGMPAADDIQGRSLAPLLLGGDPAFEAELRERRQYASAARSRAIISEDLKVSIPAKGDDEVWVHAYDRTSDPGERNNIAKALPEEVKAARAAIAAFEAECAAFVEAHPSRPGDAYLDGNQPAWMINRDVIEEKLRSLGYIE